MPRNISGIYSKPPSTTAIPNTTIQSVAYNTQVDDMVADLNAPRPVTSGGTGATNAADARTALGATATGTAVFTAVDAAAARVAIGAVIGTNVQAADATLTRLAALGTAANKMPYTTGVDTWAEATLTAAGRALLDDADVAAQLVTLGITGQADAAWITGTSTTKGVVSPDQVRQQIAANMIFSKEYVSPEQTITSGGTITLTHGLGAIPKFEAYALVCKTAEAGYVAGDVLPIGIMSAPGGSLAYSASLIRSATTLKLRFSNTGTAFMILHGTTGADTPITNAKWRLVVSAWA